MESEPSPSFLLAKDMDEHKISDSELKAMTEDWEKKISADAKYWIENDAKIRAMTNAKSYDEFSDIVKAAHLKPLTRAEILSRANKHKTRDSIWREGGAIDVKKHDKTTLDPLFKFNTAAEFGAAWRKMNLEQQREILESTPLEELGAFLQQEVPPSLLSDLTKILVYAEDKEEWLANFLMLIIKSNRFQLNMLFLSPDDVGFYATLIRKFKQQNKNTSLIAEGFGLDK